MSDWKNPNFRNNEWNGWNIPEVSENNERPDIGLVVRGLAGFIVVVALNALAIFAFLNVLGFSVDYRDAVLASVIFVFWRVYDIVLFRKIRNKE